MVQLLQKGHLNQVAVHHLDMLMRFQLVLRLVQRKMKTTFTSRKPCKALDLESYRCTAGSLVFVKPKELLVYIRLS